MSVAGHGDGVGVKILLVSQIQHSLMNKSIHISSVFVIIVCKFALTLVPRSFEFQVTAFDSQTLIV